MKKMFSRIETKRAFNWISYMMLVLLLGMYFMQAIPGSGDEGQKYGYPDAVRETVLAKAVVKSAEEFVWKIKIMPNGTLQITVKTSYRVTITRKMFRLQLPELEVFWCSHWNSFGVCKANDKSFPQGDSVPPSYATGPLQKKISEVQKLVKAKGFVEKSPRAKITKTRSIRLANLIGTPCKDSEKFNHFFISSDLSIQEKDDEGWREAKEKISTELESFSSMDIEDLLGAEGDDINDDKETAGGSLASGP